MTTRTATPATAAAAAPTPATSQPRRMRAQVGRRYGGPEVLEPAELDLPPVAADEVLIEVHAAGVDRGTWHLLSGQPYLMRILGFGLTRPSEPVPGRDLAGVVVAVGASVTRFAEGDHVFGVGRAAFAEYAVAKENRLSTKPSTASFVDAAAVSVSGATALQALTDVGHLESGQSVLVIGASGGVGSFAVQIATALGGHVTGVASAAKAAAVRSLGAEDVIDYAREDYLDGSTHYDLIIDAGGLNPVRRLAQALTPTGTLVIVGGEGGGRWTGGIGRNLRAALLSLGSRQRLTSFISREDHRYTDRLAELLEDGSITPLIGGQYPLDEAGRALADLEAGRVVGKSVLVIRPTGA